jgi:hypothetical protein
LIGGIVIEGAVAVIGDIAFVVLTKAVVFAARCGTELFIAVVDIVNGLAAYFVIGDIAHGVVVDIPCT